MQTKEINIKNRVYNFYSDNLVEVKKLKTKIFLIDKKNCKDLVFYFIRYVHSKSKNT